MPSSSPEIEARSGVVVVSATEDIDIATADTFREAVLEAVPNDACGVVLDLCRARYVDSAGIRVLFTLADRLGRRGQVMRLVVPREATLRRILGIVELEQVIPVDDSLDAAVDAVGKNGEATKR